MVFPFNGWTICYCKMKMCSFLKRKRKKRLDSHIKSHMFCFWTLWWSFKNKTCVRTTELWPKLIKYANLNIKIITQGKLVWPKLIKYTSLNKKFHHTWKVGGWGGGERPERMRDSKVSLLRIVLHDRRVCIVASLEHGTQKVGTPRDSLLYTLVHPVNIHDLNSL